MNLWRGSPVAAELRLRRLSWRLQSHRRRKRCNFQDKVHDLGLRRARFERRGEKLFAVSSNPVDLPVPLRNRLSLTEWRRRHCPIARRDRSEHHRPDYSFRPTRSPFWCEAGAYAQRR